MNTMIILIFYSAIFFPRLSEWVQILYIWELCLNVMKDSIVEKI